MAFRKKDNARTGRFELRVRSDELADIAERARRSGLSTAEFVRRAALGRRIDAAFDADAVLELRRLVVVVGQLRDAAQSASSFDAEDFRKVAAECVLTMQRMAR